MNFAPMLNQSYFFTHKVVCVRFTTEKESDDGDGPESPKEEVLDGEIDGSISLIHDTLKWRRHGKKMIEISLKDEKSRLEVLEKYFGVTFLEDNIEPILGAAAQLGPVSIQ
jgi:hypothetical protein